MRRKKADSGITTFKHSAHPPHREDAPLDNHLLRENPRGGMTRSPGQKESARQEQLHRAHKGCLMIRNSEFGDAREK